MTNVSKPSGHTLVSLWLRCHCSPGEAPCEGWCVGPVFSLRPHWVTELSFCAKVWLGWVREGCPPPAHVTELTALASVLCTPVSATPCGQAHCTSTLRITHSALSYSFKSILFQNFLSQPTKAEVSPGGDTRQHLKPFLAVTVRRVLLTPGRERPGILLNGPPRPGQSPQHTLTWLRSQQDQS